MATRDLGAAAADSRHAINLPTLGNTYAELPERFYSRIAPTPVAAPRLLRLNTVVAEQLGLDAAMLASPAGVEWLAGNRVAQGSEPLAMAYAGHQFGNFVPQLGDGRAVLLGEITDRSGVRRDIQLKGGGRTPFSRMGDGRASLGPVLREYVISEAMAGLGIPTTRSLAMVASGERVLRQRAEPGAVLARVAASHVRVGTFEYFYRRGDNEAVKALADYVIARHYPELAAADEPYRAFLEAVADRTAALIAQWLTVGFIHGVMNTDNLSIAGETIDYGPCAFMDTFDPATVFSSIDIGGRYAYNQQAFIGHWNLARFAECLLPLLGNNEAAVQTAEAALAVYPERFQAAYEAGFRRKLGLAEEHEGDAGLAQDLLRRMSEQRADHTLTFRRLSDVAGDDAATDTEVRALFDKPEAFDEWAAQWRERLAAEAREDGQRRAAMQRVNPAYIPRNHRVEEAIAAAIDADDFGPMENLLTVLSAPFQDHPELTEYAQPPQPHEVVRQTYCGT